MTPKELELFLSVNPHIQFADDFNGQVLFRNERLDWYKNDADRATAVTYEKLEELSVDGLIKAVNKGLEIDNITRITGYFTKKSSWNPGKLAELRDRKRMDLQGRPAFTQVCDGVDPISGEPSPCPMAQGQ